VLRNLIPLFFLLFSFTAFSQYVKVTNVSPNPVCAGNILTITFSATNGTGAAENKKYDETTLYQILLSSGSGYAKFGSTFTASNVPYLTGSGDITTGLITTITIPSNFPEGSYQLTIDSQLKNNPNWIFGTIPSSPFRIERPPVAPTASATLQPTCAVATGTITVSAPTGTGITYSINGSTYTNTNGTFTNVVAGTYSVTAKSAAGCISPPTSVTINSQPATPAAPTVSTTAPTCSAAGFTIIANYLSANTYTFNPAGPSVNATGLVTGATIGTAYTVKATNTATCISNASASFTNLAMLPTPVAPTVSTTAPTCSAAAVVTVTNYNSLLTYTSIPLGLSVGSGGIVSGGITGTSYTIKAQNAATCTATSASFTYDGDAQPSINTWNGSVSADWNVAANWCTGVPSISNNKDVLIPSALTTTYSPTLSTGSFGYVENILFESGSILTVEDNYLFVKTNLTLNGKIDLNDESQLVQGVGVLSTFSGAGTIEIDQQGTSDNFKYNYWGSPVNTTGTTYTIAGVLRDGTYTTGTYSTTINEFNIINFGAPYGYADGVAPLVGEAIKLSTYWMYKYANLGNGYGGWTSVREGGSLKAGEGFTMKGSNSNLTEQNYTFVGQPNNGDINITISANNDYLIGNPYPSAIDAKQFIIDNIKQDADGKTGNRLTNIIDGNLYFWDHFGGGNHLLKSYEGGYAIFNLSGSVLAVSNDVLTKNTGATSNSGKVPQRFIPVAQGFFVTSLDGGEIQFKNSQRAFQKENSVVSQFMKSAKPSSASKETNEDIFPRFHLNYSSPKGYQRQLLVAFIENTTDGIDIGYDAINYENFAEDFSWKSNDVNLIIQAVPTLNDERILPIEVKVAITGMIKINIDNAENIPEDTEIFMKDNITGKMHNISKTPFEIELTAGKYADRFEVTFKTYKLVAEDVKAEILIPAATQPIIEGIHVFMNNDNKELQIKNNSDKEILSIELYNYLGQIVKTWNSNFKIRTISLPISTSTGIYYVQINTKTGSEVQKVVVE